MDYIFEVIKKKLSLFEDMYDSIRIVNPVNRKIINFTDKRKPCTGSTCYEYWGKSSCCSNCLSMRAYSGLETFAKLEYIENKIFLILATPVRIENELYIVEILKEISKTIKILGDEFDSDYSTHNLINELNDDIAKAASSPEIYNTDIEELKIENIISKIERNLYETTLDDCSYIYMEDISLSHENQLSVLYRKIDKLRDSLNEVCATYDGVNNIDLRLDISKYLDELIVDYMKISLNYKF